MRGDRPQPQAGAAAFVGAYGQQLFGLALLTVGHHLRQHRDGIVDTRLASGRLGRRWWPGRIRVPGYAIPAPEGMGLDAGAYVSFDADRTLARAFPQP